MKRTLFVFFFGFILLFFSAQAQVQVSQPKEQEYGDPAHRATIRVESATLCPGQEVELGIYVDLLLGQEGGGSGTYTPGQLPPDPLDNFMFYLYISDTSAAEVVCSSTEHRSPTYRVGFPVLSDKMPELAGGSLTCGYIEGSSEGNLGKRGRFTCIWVRSRPSVQLIPTIERPLFKIRVRLKKAEPVTISIDDPNEIAFSTGLAQMGGYYYSFYNEPGKTPNRVPGMLSLDKGPDKSTITAGPDSVVCIGSRVFFNAEGGKSYRWSQCYNPGIAGGYNYEHLSNVNTKNPTFYPLHAGPYIYQVEVYDERGCFTRDTVFYYVQQNYLKDIAVDPVNIMVDSGSRVTFNLRGSSNNGAMGRLKVFMEPDSLFLQGKNIIWADQEAGYNQGLTVEGSLRTKSVYEPTLLVATLKDTACSVQTPAAICINGVGVTGKIAPFPVYRCGEDRQLKSLQLNLLTHGGSNNFLYNWSATDLEFTQFPGAAPKIDNPNSRAPKINYYGRFAVSVDIYDMVTGETVTISDTVIKRDWMTAETQVVLDTASLLAEGLNIGGPYCDGTVLSYKALSVNAGPEAKYIWQVNGVWKEEGINDTLFTADLYKGDSVQCILYSTEACVRNMAAESKPFSPDIRRPASPNIELVNADPYGYDYCSTVELQAVCHEMGNRFRIQWLRNGQVEKDTVIAQENPDLCTVPMSFERKGYYDGFTCQVIETDMPCCGSDTIFATVSPESMTTTYSNYSNTLYPFLSSDFQPGEVAVNMAQSVVCSTSPFTLTAKVDNLTEEFELRWYRKSGPDSILLGYYGYPYNTADFDYRLLGSRAGYGYSDGQSQEDLLRPFEDGFRIVLNDPSAVVNARKSFAAGDTVFFVLTAQYFGSCFGDFQTYTLRSPYFVPSLVEPAPADVLTVDYLEKGNLCPGDEHAYHLVATMGGEASYRLDWTFGGSSVTDTSAQSGNPAQYFRLSGPHDDTLQSRIVVKPEGISGTWGTCTATITDGCNAGHTQTVQYNLNSYVLNAPWFRVRHSSDTIVCAGEPVEHWAGIEEISGGNSSASTRKEENYEISWALSLSDLLSGNNSTVGSTFVHTPVPNGNTPNGSGDINDNRGIFTCYIQAHEKESGCEVVDSVQVMVAHPYEVKATVDFLLPDGPWCDSSLYVAEDATRQVEGFNYQPGVQYAVLHLENGGDRPFVQWLVDGEEFRGTNLDTLSLAGVSDGATLKAMVKSSMYTCLPDKVETEPQILQVAHRGDLHFSAPASAAAGEEFLLEAFVSEHLADARQLAGGYGFDYFMVDPDGSRQPLSLNHQPQQGAPDTLKVKMPAFTGVFNVESHDKYNVCPVQKAQVNLALAVSTNISMRIFDPATKREIKGLCPQSYGFVYADGQPAPQNAQAVWVNGTREPMDVFVRTYPENPSGKAYVVYYKSGTLRAMGPVGTTADLSFDPNENGGDVRILERGDTITAHILPGEWFGAMYIHDTVSIDGSRTHYTDQILLDVMDTVGRLTLKAQPSAVCPGETVSLSAEFEKGQASVSWAPEGAFVATTAGTATAVPVSSTVYSAVAQDPNGCYWRDSMRVNVVEGSMSLPLAILTDSVDFCGETAQADLRIDTRVSQAEDFSKFYWYIVEQNGNRLIDSTDEPSLRCTASDGMRVMAQARSVLSCQTDLSQSDTLVFTAFAYPELNRLKPLAADTSVCPLSDVTVAYEVSPQNALMQWYGVTEDYSEDIEDATDRFSFVPDESTCIIVTAKNPDKPVCAVIDTVTINVLDAGASAPQIEIKADKMVVCDGEEITYTATALYHDRILWFANHELLSDTSSVLTRVPRVTGFNGKEDSVYAWAIRNQTGCAPADTAKADPVLAWRVERPVLVLQGGDTTVFEGSPVLLQASASVYDGEPAQLTWHNASGQILATGSAQVSYETPNPTKGEYRYYVKAFQTDLEEDLPQCYSVDSLLVTVTEDVGVEISGENLVSITPNPTSGRFTIQTIVPCRIEIFSLSGTRVWFRENALGKIPATLHVSGVYFVRVMEPATGRSVIQKLVVR